MKYSKCILSCVVIVLSLSVTIIAKDGEDNFIKSSEFQAAKINSRSNIKAKHDIFMIQSIYSGVEGAKIVSSTDTTRTYQLIDGSITNKSYYVLVDGKWQLKTNTFYSGIFGETEEYYSTSQCTASQEPNVPFSCASNVKAYSQYGKYASGKLMYEDSYTFYSSAEHDRDYASFNQKDYHSNGKLYKHIYRKRTSSGYLLAGGYDKVYNINGQLTKYLYLDSSNRAVIADLRSYYFNKKLASRYYLKFNAGKSTFASRIIYRSNGSKDTYRKVAFKSGKAYNMYEYHYNSKSQLKSNKYGNAYRTYYGINSSYKVYKVYRSYYNYKAKLQKSYKISNYNNNVRF